MFVTATRNKLRFPSNKGMLSVEDLWDLSTNSLNEIYKTLRVGKKETEEEGLIEVQSKEAEILDTQLSIVEFIFKTKVTEKEARQDAAEKRERKKHIMSLIAEKQDEALKGKSLEELQAELDSL
jgi:hypothetical protein